MKWRARIQTENYEERKKKTPEVVARYDSKWAWFNLCSNWSFFGKNQKETFVRPSVIWQLRKYDQLTLTMTKWTTIKKNQSKKHFNSIRSSWKKMWEEKKWKIKVVLATTYYVSSVEVTIKWIWKPIELPANAMMSMEHVRFTNNVSQFVTISLMRLTYEPIWFRIWQSHG